MNGILLIDKPTDWTSNDVVQKLRGILHERRIGHAGTLDPMATGLLTVFVGRATRAVEYAEADAKRYRALLRPGVITDTQDSTGTVLETRDASGVTMEKLKEVLGRFLGKQMQVPPMYSAVKINGQRLYKAARRGESVERPARPIEVHSIRLLGREGDDWQLDIRCSKGTYVRTLCADIGEALGCGAFMSGLRRLEAGAFSVNDAHTLEDVQAAANAGRAEDLLLPTDTLFSWAGAMTVSAAAEKRIRNGNAFSLRHETLPENLLHLGASENADGDPDRACLRIRLYAPDGAFLALGEVRGEECRIIKSFFEVSNE